MSKYLLNKFLFTVDRDPEWVARYREDPRGFVSWWEKEKANRLLNCHAGEASTWLRFTHEEREALATHDYVRLFEMGALFGGNRRPQQARIDLMLALGGGLDHDAMAELFDEG